jgi:hypothetical protein
MKYLDVCEWYFALGPFLSSMDIMGCRRRFFLENQIFRDYLLHELLGITILPLHGMYGDMSPSPPTSIHSQRIGILPSQERGMPILQECIEVGGEGIVMHFMKWENGNS